MTESTDLREAMRDLKGSIDELRKELVRKDVYDADQRGIGARFVTAEKDIHDLAALIKEIEDRRAADRRLIITALVLPVLLIVFQIYLAAALPGGGS